LQVLEFINCQLFNQLLLRPECCSASNARYVLRGLKQLDGWVLAEHGSTDGYEANTAAAAAAAAAGTAAGTAAAATAAAAGDDTEGVGRSSSSGVGDSAGKHSNDQKEQKQDVPAAAAAAAEEGDASWEQVLPADSGEIDNWQPPKQQQQQSRVRLWQWQQQQQQQQQQQGPLLQHDIGPEAWNALSHIRQVRWLDCAHIMSLGVCLHLRTLLCISDAWIALSHVGQVGLLACCLLQVLLSSKAPCLLLTPVC
jgi:hypothetical protein